MKTLLKKNWLLLALLLLMNNIFSLLKRNDYNLPNNRDFFENSDLLLEFEQHLPCTM